VETKYSHTFSGGFESAVFAGEAAGVTAGEVEEEGEAATAVPFALTTEGAVILGSARYKCSCYMFYLQEKERKWRRRKRQRTRMGRQQSEEPLHDILSRVQQQAKSRRARSAKE
jgi:hypothetical protein